MKKTLLSLGLSLALVSPALIAASPAPGKPQLGSFGIDLGNRDTAAKPGDDFNRYANGHWTDTYQLKDYESRYGSFNVLSDQAEEQVRTIIEELAANKELAPGSNEQKIRDFYASYMDKAARDAAGIKPIQSTLDSIAAIDSQAALIAAFGRSDIDGSESPIGIGLAPDRKNPDRYLVGINVGGLGLPDKDFYLNTDARFVAIRAAYIEHITRMLGFAGIKDGKSRAEAVLALETGMAKKHWDRAERRDRDKTYNLVTIAELNASYPGYDWAAQFAAQGMPVPAEVNVSTPSATGPVLEIIAATPLAVWRQ